MCWTELRLTELRLVWGPLDLLDDAVSFADDWEWIIYTPEEMAEAILSVEGVSLLHDSNPSWNKWRAQWRRMEHTIDFDIAACELDPDFGGRSGVSEYWGGSMFRTNCMLEDIMDVWLGIQKTCPAVWLHDTDCRMYNPRTFMSDLPSKIADWSR